jgi:hypothetical protein
MVDAAARRGTRSSMFSWSGTSSTPGSRSGQRKPRQVWARDLSGGDTEGGRHQQLLLVHPVAGLLLTSTSARAVRKSPRSPQVALHRCPPPQPPCAATCRKERRGTGEDRVVAAASRVAMGLIPMLSHACARLGKGTSSGQEAAV